MIAKGSRANEPIQGLEVGEELTTCVYCGTRTELIEPDILDADGEHARREDCPHCGQRYHVYDADEEDSEDEGELPEASDEDVRHLFGLPPRSPEWGSF